MRRWGGIIVLALSINLPLPQAAASEEKHVDHSHWPDKYDRHFRKYAKHYFGAGFDWRWFKAQGIAESGLKPGAKSPAGALGIMQILPSTYKEIKRENPHFKNMKDPHWNIAAAIFYDRKMYRRWQKAQAEGKHLALAFASYNAGYAKVRRGYKKAAKKHRKVAEWDQLTPFLPGETARYVERIHRLMQRAAP